MDAIVSAFGSLTGGWTLPAALAGVTWGILGGALPGLSPSVAMALLLPLTYGMDPTAALTMLAAVYVGAEYGGSIPAILIRTPGTNAAAATTVDGYELARQGRAGEALGISLMAGFVGGMFGLILLALATEPMAAVALAFTPPAYCALGVLGLSVIASLSGKSLLKGLISGVLGLMIATIGTDPVSGVSRFTAGSPELLSGVRPILVMVGLFAVTEMLTQISAPPWDKASRRDTRLKLPKLSMWRRLWKSQVIGCVIGTFEGLTPGGGGSIASFISYNEARRWSSKPEEFGKGSVEGVAAPECANNVVTATALIPMLSLGIPGSNSAAVLLGGFLIHGLIPGPMLFQKAPEVVYGLYGGLFAANILMVLVGMVILTPCIWLVNRPKPYLIAFILAIVVSGVYATDTSITDLWIVLGMGVVGYAMRWFGMPVLPLVLGAVLGFMVESNYRRSLVLARGDHSIFIQDPVALGLLLAALALTAYSVWREYLKPEPKEVPA
jgi:putative tricarboxylic transport membrane protein